MDLKIISQSPLFKEIKMDEIQPLLQCLSAKSKSISRGEYIFYCGDTHVPVGMVLSGGVHIVHEDFWGNRSIFAEVLPGDLFGESYACLSNLTVGVSAVAAEDGEVLLLDVEKLLTVCSSNCVFHNRLIRNLLEILAYKNLMLTKKIQHTSERTTRDKLLSYLSEQSLQNNSRSFVIPFNRQQLAEYLSVDRSAMSAELSKLQKEGILSYQKNHFELLQETKL